MSDESAREGIKKTTSKAVNKDEGKTFADKIFAKSQDRKIIDKFSPKALKPSAESASGANFSKANKGDEEEVTAPLKTVKPVLPTSQLEEVRTYGTNLGEVINFAKITSTHGIRGFFVVEPYFNNVPEYIKQKLVYFYDKQIELKIEGQGPRGGIILSSPHINNPENAKQMVGKFLKCRKSDIPSAEQEGEYTVAHLIGLPVYWTGTSKKFATVTDVVDMLGSIMLEVEMHNEKTGVSKTEYILFDANNINDVNIPKGYIYANKLDTILG